MEVPKPRKAKDMLSASNAPTFACLFGLWACILFYFGCINWTYYVPSFAAVVCCVLFVMAIPSLQDQKIWKLVATDYPQLAINRVWDSGKRVSYYADAQHHLRCNGEVVLSGTEVVEAVQLFPIGHQSNCERELEPTAK